MSDLFARRVPLAGRRLTIHAPAGDYAFSRYKRGKGFSEYQALCRGLLAPDSVVLDVGANIGLSTLVAAELVPRGQVIAVEGAPRNFSALSRNIADHAAGVATPVHCAVGAKAGEVAFIDNSAFGHVSAPESMIPLPSTRVRARPIDDIVAWQGLERVDFIKIDIEGFEQDALIGAEATLARFDPVVFLEFNAYCQIALYDRSPRRFLDWLMARFPELHAWREGRLVSVHEIGAVRFLQTNMTDRRCNDDLVAVRAGEKLEGLRRLPPRGGLIGRLAGRLKG